MKDANLATMEMLLVAHLIRAKVVLAQGGVGNQTNLLSSVSKTVMVSLPV